MQFAETRCNPVEFLNYLIAEMMDNYGKRKGYMEKECLSAEKHSFSTHKKHCFSARNTIFQSISYLGRETVFFYEKPPLPRNSIVRSKNSVSLSLPIPLQTTHSPL